MPDNARLQSLLRATPGAALVLAVAAGGAYALWQHTSEPSVIDGRYKAEFEMPSIETVLSTDWMGAVDTYVDERLPGRDSLLATHASITNSVFRDPLVNGIYVDGPGGQLLEKPPVLAVRPTLGDEAAALAANVGPAPVLWVYAPRKEEIFADAMPAAWPDTYAAVHDEIVSEFSAAGAVLDLTGLMAERRAGDDAYFKTDHHWTPDSARAVADAIAVRLAADGTPIGTDDRAYSEVAAPLPFYGSTGRQVTLGGTAPDDVTVPVPAGGFEATMCAADECGQPTLDSTWLEKRALYGNRYRAFLGGNHGMAIITNDSPHASGRVLLLTDSFGNAVATYLAERVAQLVVIDERHYDGVAINALAAQIQPDAVVVMHNPLSLLTPSFNAAVWTTSAPLPVESTDPDAHATAVYDDVAVVTKQGLMLVPNHEQPLDSTLADDALALANAIDRTGAAQAWFYAPRKEEVFADLVPSTWGNPVADKRQRVLELLGEGHATTDLTPALSDPSNRDRYFFRTDHHWTAEGAEVAVNAIVDSLAEQGVVLPTDSRVWRRVDGPLTFSGSDALLLPKGAPTVSEPMWYLEPDGGFRAKVCEDTCDQPVIKQEWLSNPDPLANRFYAFLGGGFQTTHLHNDSPNAHGTVVMLKDSYAYPVAVMLAERVTDLYLVDERGWDGEPLGQFVTSVDADAVVVLHNQVSLLSQAFNRDVWRNAGQ